MLLTKFSQTLRISLALIVAVFSTGILPTASAYAIQPEGTGPPAEVQTEVQSLKSDKKDTESTTPKVVQVPVAPDITDNCGPNNATWNKPDSTAEMSWELKENGKLSVTILSENTVFPDNKTNHDYGMAQETNVTPCEQQQPTDQTPPKEDGDVQSGIAEPLITPPKSETITTLNAKVRICHRTASYTNPYVENEVDANAVDGVAGNSGNEPDHFGEHKGPIFYPSIPKHTEWGDIIPDVGGNGGLNWTEEGQAIWEADCKVEGAVVPTAPSFYDLCGTENDYINIPETKGVIYKVNGEIVDEGHMSPPASTVMVTAHADDEYALDPDSPSSWSFTFTNDDCITITKTAAIPTDTNSDGSIGVGDRITWTIVVTNTAQNDFETLDVTITDPGATFAGSNVITGLAPGASATLTAYTTITSANINTICSASNTANFSATYSMNEEESMLESRVAPEFTSTGSATATVVFTCPTSGQVLGTSVQLGGGRGGGQILGTTALPATLPSTGGTASPLLIILASILAYGAAYFLQGRRILGRTEEMSV